MLGAPNTITIVNEYLYAVAEPLKAAWAQEHPGATLQFISIYTSMGPNKLGPMVNQTTVAENQIHQQGIDIIGVASGDAILTKLLDLDPWFTASNIDIAQIAPAATGAFTIGGQRRAVPLFPSQVQFYVNAAALGHLDAPPTAVPTWAAFQSTLRNLVGARGGAAAVPPPCAGLTWADFRIWGACVVGLGGQLTTGGRFDVEGVLDATKEIVAFAQSIGWEPGPAKGSALSNFYPNGFEGGTALSAFAFCPPWTVDFYGMLPTPSGPTPTGNAVARLPVTPFPSLPVRSVVPVYQIYGAGVSPLSQRVEQAMTFLAWLIQPPQQRILMDAGIPPVITSSTTLSYWASLHRAPSTPLCDERALLDVTTALPPPRAEQNGGSAVAAYMQIIGSALTRMYHGSSVETELVGVAQAIASTSGVA